MKKLVVICQKVDETDDLLGFFVGWLREFAKHYDQVEVVTLAEGEYSLPSHVQVYSLGKEKGVSKLFWLPKMKWLLLKHSRGASGIFCHMSPVFALIAWPSSRLYGAKLVLWYLHRSVTMKLKLALHLVDSLVTADEDSLNIKSKKIVSTGHGIDTERFAVQDRDYDLSRRSLRMISVGRLSPIKDFGTLIRAGAILKEQGKDIQIRIVGRPVVQRDHDYAQELHHMVDGLGLEDTVAFVGFVPYRDMPAQYAWADIVVGGTPKGGLDKTIFEGMAAGCMPITSNEAMRHHFSDFSERSMYRHKDADDLADRISAFLDASSSYIVKQVPELVAQYHSLPKTIGKIIMYL